MHTQGLAVLALAAVDADTLAATVIAVRPGEADLRVHWDRVLRSD